MRVISGADDSVIRAVSGLAPGDRFGHAVAGAGDGDGVPDLIVGAPGTVGSSPPFGANGAVTVFSGADGSILHYVTGSIPGARTGRSVGAAGDVNGDGFDDVVIGAANAVTVVSDADGSPRVLLLASDPGLGTSLADGVDVDGDGIDLNGGGIPDVLAGAPAAESELRGGAVRKLAAAGAAP